MRNELSGQIALDSLLAPAVEAAGYEVRAETVAQDEALDAAAAADADRRARETRRLGFEAAAALVIGALMMVSSLWLTSLVPLEQLNWLLLIPATFVQLVSPRAVLRNWFVVPRSTSTP